MQCFRLMGMPDSVIAFDALPESLVSGFEMCKADGFPRHWKEWLGKKKRKIEIPPEKEFLTGQVRRFDPIVEEDSYFYLVDWTIQPTVEKWEKVCDYVRQNVSKDFRVSERLGDMAKKLAANKTDGVTLEPEEVVVIPLPKASEALVTAAAEPKKADTVNCPEEGCSFEAQGSYAKNSLRMHKTKKHKVTAEVVA